MRKRNWLYLILGMVFIVSLLVWPFHSKESIKAAAQNEATLSESMVPLLDIRITPRVAPYTFTCSDGKIVTVERSAYYTGPLSINTLKDGTFPITLLFNVTYDGRPLSSADYSPWFSAENVQIFNPTQAFIRGCTFGLRIGSKEAFRFDLDVFFTTTTPPIQNTITADTNPITVNMGATLDLKNLIKNVKYNGAALSSNLYTVESITAISTSTAGVKIGKVRVKYANDTSVATEVTTNVTVLAPSIITAEAVSQTVLIGASLNAKSLVKNVKLDGTILSSDKYNVSFRTQASTSTVGIKTATVRVQKADNPNVFVDVNVPVTVIDLTAEAIPQIVPIGAKLNAENLVQNVKLDGTILASDKYSVSYITEATTNTVGNKMAKVRVIQMDNPSIFIDVDVPVTVAELTGAAISQIVPVGAVLDSKNLINNIKLNGKPLSSSGYSSYYIDEAVTDTIGDKTAKVRVLYGENADIFVDIEVPVTVAEIKAEAIPQVVPLEANLNAINLVTNIKLNGTYLLRGEYGAYFIKEVMTNTIGEKTAKVRISSSENADIFVDVDVPVIVAQITAEAIPQIVKVGANLDSKDLIKNIKLNGTILSSDMYTAYFLEEVPTDTVGEKIAKVQILYAENADIFVDVDIPVTVVDNILAVEANPQKVMLGASINTNNLIKNVKLNETVLAKDKYETTLLSPISTSTVGQKIGKTKTTLTISPTLSVDADVDINVVWGNTIAVGADDDSGTERTSGAFTLYNQTNPYIIASQGLGDDNLPLNLKYVNQAYYSFSHFDMSVKSSPFLITDLLKAETQINAEGSDLKQTILNEWGTNQIQAVNYSDIVRVYQREVNKSWLYEEEQRNIYNEDKEFVYYEIAENGYKPLHFNQLKTNDGEIAINTSKKVLDDHINDYIVVGSHTSVKVKGFSTYPDTSTPGKKIGIIRVEETLSNGKLVQYDYPVNFDINTQNVTIKFENTLGKPLHDEIVLEKMIGETIDLSNEDDIQNALALISKDKFQLKQRPTNENSLIIGSEPMTLKYIFDGILSISSTPKIIDFGTSVVGIFPIKIEKASYDEPLIIWDNRAEMKRWTLTATLQQALTNKEDSTKVLSSAIQYKKNSSETVILVKNRTIPIAIHTHSDAGEYNVSDQWETGTAGFQLEVAAGTVRKLGDYEATILWQLGNTP